MKKTMLFSVALAGLMLGSCSSSDDLGSGGTSESKNGNGYVAFTINLPSQPSSRAGSFNDDYKDGKAAEYKVNNATILLFSGTDEATANFVAAYKLGTEPWSAPAGDGNNVTTTSKKVVQKVTKSIDNAKALVILNNNDVFTVDEATAGIKFDGTAFTGTYTDFLKKSGATSGKTLTSDGFYMANAPLCNKQGDTVDPTSAAKVTTLTDLTGKIYETEAAAIEGEAAQVYVERAVAKVTLDKGSVSETTNGTITKVPFEVTGWAIDNYNPTTYLVRSAEGFGDWKSLASKGLSARQYRFVGGTAVAANLYRTYFAKDMNYNTDAKSVLQRASSFATAFGDDNPQYCFENTFDVAHQNEDQTTLVTIKAKLNSGADFYIVGGDQTKLYTKKELENLVKNKFISNEESWIKANTKPGETVGADENDITVTFDKDEAGSIALKKIKVADSKLIDSPSALPSDYLKDVSAAVGSIVYYKNGESYYTVRIKHFGDDLTPWKNGELSVGPGKVYPTTDQAANWLGRYGVLRNNWYDIEVTGVKGLGSATVPTLSNTTDDELDSYIAVQINVLSWAKRTQSTVLH